MEPQVFDLLKYLIANRNRLVSREEIFDEIWSGRIVSDTSLSNHIKSARKVIGDNGRSQSCIKTVHSRGYQFIASTEEVINHGSDLALLPVDDSIGRSENRGPLIMVLPFQNMSSDPEQQFFAEGMSEDIITELSRFTDLQVIARHTAFQFASVSHNIDKFARELSVEYLVEGSVRRTQDRVRINAQLIDASSGNHIWAEKYDRAMRLNPLHPGWYWMELGIIYYSMGEYQKAIDAYYKNWDLEAYDLALIGATYIAMNEIDRAEEAAQQALVIEPKSSANLYTQFETYQDKEKHKLLCDRMTAAGIPA